MGSTEVVLLHLVQQQFLCSQSDPVSPIVVVLERPPPHQGGRAAGDGGLKEDFFFKKNIFTHFISCQFCRKSYYNHVLCKSPRLKNISPGSSPASWSGRKRPAKEAACTWNREKKVALFNFFSFKHSNFLPVFSGAPAARSGRTAAAAGSVCWAAAAAAAWRRPPRAQGRCARTW